MTVMPADVVMFNTMRYNSRAPLLHQPSVLILRLGAYSKLIIMNNDKLTK